MDFATFHIKLQKNWYGKWRCNFRSIRETAFCNVSPALNDQTSNSSKYRVSLLTNYKIEHKTLSISFVYHLCILASQTTHSSSPSFYPSRFLRCRLFITTLRSPIKRNTHMMHKQQLQGAPHIYRIHPWFVFLIDFHLDLVVV